MNIHKNIKFSTVDGRKIEEIEEITVKEFQIGDIWPDLIEQERQFIIYQLTIFFIRFPSVGEVKNFPLNQLEEIFKMSLINYSSNLGEMLYKLILIKITNQKSKS